MTLGRIEELQARIQEEQKDLPFLPSYLRPWGLLERAKQELRAHADEPKLPELIRDLEEYISLGNETLREQAMVPEQEAAKFVAFYCLEAANDPYCDEYEVLFGYLLAYYGDGSLFHKVEEIALLHDIVLGYRKGNFPWRGKKEAKRLKELLALCCGHRLTYEALSSFYKAVLDYASAYEAANCGAELLLKEGKIKDAALLKRDALASQSYLPGFVAPNEEDIQALYGEETPIVLEYPRFASLKHDPVEHTPEFQAVYDEVMEVAMGKYLEERGPKIPQLLWGYMEEGFREHGILWKNPQWMNPDARFD